MGQASKELTSRDITGAHTGFLIKHLKSARENHVTMSLGMLAVPSALAIHRDRTRFRAFMDYWRWFIRLSIGPNGAVYYHGNNQGVMGDRQLGQDRMAPVTHAMMLAVGQGKLHIHGGFPAIEGITYSELPSRLQTIYSQIRTKRYKSALSALAGLVTRRPSKTTVQSRSMMDYVMEIVHHYFAEIKAAHNSGDYVLVKTLLAAAKSHYGQLKIYKQYDVKLKAEWNKPENKTRIKRGNEFYRLLKLLDRSPRSFHKLMRRFVEADVDGFYSRMPSVSRIRAEVLRQ